MPSRKPAPPSRAHSARPTGPAAMGAPHASAVLGGVLQRMGEVLGPGAVYSLVHYGATEEGRHLVDQGAQVGAADAVQLVAAVLDLEATVEAEKDRLVRVHIQPAPHLDLEDRACVALVVGLLEGALTTARRRKVQVMTDAAPAADGSLKLDLEG